MVLNGQLSLIDFGWATVDGAVPCNITKHLFVDKLSPCDDEKVLKVLEGFSSFGDEKAGGGSGAYKK